MPNSILYTTENVNKWRCPECGKRHMTEDNLTVASSVKCDLCKEEFMPKSHESILKSQRPIAKIAEDMGLITYDVSLPNEWINYVREVALIEPVGNIVWCYKTKDWEHNFGLPVAVSAKGKELLSWLAGRTR